MKKTYDFAFALGASCSPSLALRAAKMQFASFPFDWTAGGDIVGRAQIVADRFKDWLWMEDLELTDVLHAPFNSSIYRNRKSGITFPHAFPAGCYLEDELPVVAEKSRRREDRLFREIEKSRRVLVVYSEIPYRPVAADAAILKAWQILQQRLPQVSLDLVYFAQDPEGVDRLAVELNDHVTKVTLDYCSIVLGFIGLAPLYHKMVRFLVTNCEVIDTRTDAEKAAYAAFEQEVECRRWGVGFRRWLNKRLYHLYRHLDRYLAREGCVLGMERPLKLYQERGERRPSIRQPDISSLPRDEAAAQRAYGLL